MKTHNLTFTKYIDYCKLNKLSIPSWLTGAHFNAVLTLYVHEKKLEACKYLIALSKKFVTNPPFDLRWAKTQVMDVFDLYGIAKDLNANSQKITKLGWSTNDILKDLTAQRTERLGSKPKTTVFKSEQSKNFDKLCRGINWKKMAKARQSVKALRNKKTAFDYLSKFLDELADVATDTHRIPQNVVYPSGANAKLVTNSLKRKN